MDSVLLLRALDVGFRGSQVVVKKRLGLIHSPFDDFHV